jgi:3-deoxy-D-manno-octulosonic-acid transferase
MIEPAAFGAAVLFGPNTWNFRDVVQTFKEANACVQLDFPAQLTPAVARLLAGPMEKQALGNAARNAVKAQSGATANTAQLLVKILDAQAVKQGIFKNQKAA